MELDPERRLDREENRTPEVGRINAFDYWRGMAGMVAGPLLALAILLAPLSSLAVVTTSLMSEVGSNTSSVNIVLPVILAAAETLPISSLTIGVGATLGASMGFMLPVSTPPNAIVYGSGQMGIIDMIMTGFFCSMLPAFS